MEDTDLLMVAVSPVSTALHLEGMGLLMQVFVVTFHFPEYNVDFLLQVTELPMLAMELPMLDTVPLTQVRDHISPSIYTGVS